MRKITVACLVLAGCGNLNHVGRAPEFSPLEGNSERSAMYSSLPETTDNRGPTEQSSLWTVDFHPELSRFFHREVSHL